MYNEDCFNGDELREVASRMVEQIRQMNSDGDNVDTVLSRGSSGCSLASAILALADFNLYHVYIRKPGEKPHSGNNEYAGRWGNGNAVIVDDLVASGNTVDTILKSEPVRYREEECGAKIVGVLVGSRGVRNHKNLPVYHCGKY